MSGTLPPYGPAISSAALTPVSRTLFEWDARWTEWNPDTGTLSALSGHVGTLLGVNAQTTISDSYGNGYTAAGYVQPAWYANPSGQFGLVLDINHYLQFDGPVYMPEQSGVMEFIECGGASLSSDGYLWFIGDSSGATKPYAYLSQSPTPFRLPYVNAAGTVKIAQGLTAPTLGQQVRIRWEWTAATITMWQSINGAAETSVTGAGQAMETWPSGSPLYISLNGAAVVQRLKMMAGVGRTTELLARR